jgi:hypothetical protein
VDQENSGGNGLSRRSALKKGAMAALVVSNAAILEQVVIAPLRASAATTGAGTAAGTASATGSSAPSFSDIQFDIGRFITPAVTENDGAGNVTVQFGPVFTVFLPATLTRCPTKSDQSCLASALNTIESCYPASPSGVLITSVSYGLPYFNRLPQSLVSSAMPKLASDTGRSVLEEAVPFPTDVSGGVVGGPNATIPNVTKDRFNVNVKIEKNDVLFQFRSDTLANLTDVVNWLEGSCSLHGQHVASPAFSGLFRFDTTRVQFVQNGMPRKVADQNNLEFASRINPNSPMVMGFSDQQTDSSGPAAITTFAGNASAKLTTAKPGDYFDNGSIAHFSHVIDDLYQFYATPNQDSKRPDGEPFIERVQYMFRSNQTGTPTGVPTEGSSTDAFTDGGGPAFVNNVFQGADSAQRAARDSGGQFTSSNATQDATFTGLPRIGHEAALQEVSRAADGTPLHIRMDGPGFDGMDVPAFTTFPGSNGVAMPAGSNQFKLQFIMFVPTADLFARMRAAAAAQDFQHQFLDDEDDDNGLERFITATRRQNFLVPPRRNRAFPLIELT